MPMLSELRPVSVANQGYQACLVPFGPLCTGGSTSKLKKGYVCAPGVAELHVLKDDHYFVDPFASKIYYVSGQKGGVRESSQFPKWNEKKTKIERFGTCVTNKGGDTLLPNPLSWLHLSK